MPMVITNKEDMKYVLRKLLKEYRNWELSFIVNIDKTKYLYVGTERQITYFTTENQRKDSIL